VTKNHQIVPKESDNHDAEADAAGIKSAHQEIKMKTQVDPWIARVRALLRGLGPYVAIEMMLPGGSIIALLIWLYRHRGSLGVRTCSRRTAAAGALSAPVGIPPHLSLPGHSKPESVLVHDHHALGHIEIATKPTFCEGRKAVALRVMHPGVGELELQRRYICAQHASQAQ
jgi:hypothetical protein